jgi:hypothetical protein
VFGGQYYNEISIALEEQLFGEKFEVNFGEGCMRSMQLNVGFGYQLRICPRTEENHGKSG